MTYTKINELKLVVPSCHCHNLAILVEVSAIPDKIILLSAGRSVNLAPTVWMNTGSISASFTDFQQGWERKMENIQIEMCFELWFCVLQNRRN